jgi:hypothetical protein
MTEVSQSEGRIASNARHGPFHGMVRAEALDATLLTLDRRLAGAPGLECRVEIA